MWSQIRKKMEGKRKKVEWKKKENGVKKKIEGKKTEENFYSWHVHIDN